MDRSEASRCLAKILAYIACGKPELGRPYAHRLMEWFNSAGVL